MGSDTDAAAPALLLVGGGLANGLIALRLRELRPEVSVRIVEAGDRLGGEHTWSFFGADVTAQSMAWLEPLIAYRWPSYEVRFPKHSRRFPMGYASVTSDRLHDAVMSAVGAGVRLGAPAAAIAATSVTLADQSVLTADVVIDGRGPGPLPHLTLGFQKFVGLEVELVAEHDVSAPIIMDATVPQEDGYRFVYVLPLSPTRLLIEDTRYSDGPGLDGAALDRGVIDYAAAHGWKIASVVRREEGVLPVALDGDIEAHWAAAGGVAQSGLRAALFHPTTGYSLPCAVRLAETIAALPVISQKTVEAAIREASITAWREGGIYRLLNRMLFRAASPDKRYKVLERFYRLPEALIGRFYAGASTSADKVRILVGKPPVPILKALRCLRETGRA